jgi:muramoyltetrapeptide carboxypeptidase
MNRIPLALVAPSGTFLEENLAAAIQKARGLGFDIISPTAVRRGHPGFLNGTLNDRIVELTEAESLPVQGIWAVRGGCGALSLLPHYPSSAYQTSSLPLIGYSDITILHFMRFYRASRIGIHGPMLLELNQGDTSHLEALKLLITKEAQRLVYPALNCLSRGILSSLSAELLPMNLASLQSLIGCFDQDFLRGKILALEDINEPHYKVFRIMHQLKNARLLAGLKALLIGYFSDDRRAIIEETIAPIAESEGVAVFDWPIFGHERPNWPLLFGAKVTINRIDESFFTLTYNEQHDHTTIHRSAS